MNVDRCRSRLRDCGPVVALLRGDDGYSRPHCQLCLDVRLDAADDHPMLEPRNVWWLAERSPA